MNLEDHLYSRHYDLKKYKNHVLDKENNILTVYLNNLSGQFVGFQQYRPLQTAKKLNDPKQSRYFTYSPKQTNAVWGLETLDNSKKELYIVEGIFKASSLHILGYNAIAVLTSNPKHLKSWLHTLPFNLTGIGDNDKAGKGVISVAGKGFCLEKDLDEYELKELEELINETRSQ